GLSAMEFALILPAMVMTFFGIGELSTWLQASSRMTTVASSIADLVAQDTAIDDTEMNNIMGCARAILEPFNPANGWVRVSSIVADASGDTTVAWSDALNTSPRAEGSAISVPAGTVTPGMSVIFTEVSYTYTSTYGMFLTSGATTTDEFYAKPRRSVSV
ncbi:MAG TPA: pilus assembly protein, partial [Alphaproteobacteria bacterium]|nr:pilus assembly protein [Alphaproteobacteria bacterium]